jgi:hypothetical protein
MLEGKALRKALGKFPAISVIQAQLIASELNDAFEKGNDPTLPTRVQDAPRPRVSVAEGWDCYIADCERRGVRSVHKLNLMGRKDVVAALDAKLLSFRCARGFRRSWSLNFIAVNRAVNCGASRWTPSLSRPVGTRASQ